MLSPGLKQNSQIVLAAAVTGIPTAAWTGLSGASWIYGMAKFVRAGGGTTCKAWLQTTFDNAATWMDIMFFSFTTTTATNVLGFIAKEQATALVPGDAALATTLVAVLGDQFRWKYTTTGTYTGASSLDLSFVIG